MARRTFFLPSLTAWFAGSVLALAQSPTPAQAPPAQRGNSAERIAHVTLGQSAAPLYGPWKFVVGDAPIDPATGQPLWAEPNFDDSRWEDVDLTPAAGAQNPVTGISGYVPGWTARGHAGYWGYAWYRIRVRIGSNPGVRLALAGPGEVDDAYQVFDNGVFVGNFGDFSSHIPGAYYARTMMFALPQFAADSGGVSTQVIAFRIWMQPQTLYEAGAVGGFEMAPVIGEASTIALVHQSQLDDLIRAYLWQPIEAIVLGLLGILAFSLAFFDRSDRVYLWIGGLLLMAAIDATSGTLAVWTSLIHARYDVISHDFVLFSCEYAGWVMIWRFWFRQRSPGWLPWALIPMIVLLSVSQSFAENFFQVFAGTQLTAVGQEVSLIVRLALAAFLLLIVVRAIREQGIEGWLALPPVLLASTAEFSHEIQQLGMRTEWFPFGVQIGLAVASRLLLVVVLTILLVRRLVLSLRRQRLIALDVKQAQEVQQVILPEARLGLPGLTVESEYRPAREVGGDFFQIIPHKADCSLLIVAGDVTGKGLKAGMLVALLVGAIRTAAETSDEPRTILTTLNRRLMGRGDAQATCLALRIASDGAATLANAGHMAPYLNGELLPMEGALPLGMIEGAEASVMHFPLKPGDRLMLLSDGVAEARDADGRLFGFERVNELLRTATTAYEVASAAQTFGQADDISVISVTRVGVREGAVAP